MRAELAPASRPAQRACCVKKPANFTCDDADRELEAVAAVQRLLLPNRLPEVPGLDVAVSYRPARQASGDHYDFLRLPDGRWGFFIADVSGHGAAAAVVAAAVHATVRAFPNPESPADLLAFVNERLVAERPDWLGLFVTAFYAVLDPVSGVLTYSTAGHPPPRLYSPERPGARALDDVEGLPLGIEAGMVFDAATTTVTTGDLLVLYTDGVTEARDGSGEWFGVRQLDAAVQRAEADAGQVIASVTDELKLIEGGSGRADDQTLVVARFH
jgi:sigma-B regulation protein RsbU (phosphoserine phosphatase)